MEKQNIGGLNKLSLSGFFTIISLTILLAIFISVILLIRYGWNYGFLFFSILFLVSSFGQVKFLYDKYKCIFNQKDNVCEIHVGKDAQLIIDNYKKKKIDKYTLLDFSDVIEGNLDFKMKRRIIYISLIAERINFAFSKGYDVLVIGHNQYEKMFLKSYFSGNSKSSLLLDRIAHTLGQLNNGNYKWYNIKKRVLRAVRIFNNYGVESIYIPKSKENMNEVDYMISCQGVLYDVVLEISEKLDENKF